MAVDESVLKDQYKLMQRAMDRGTSLLLYNGAITSKTGGLLDGPYVDIGALSPDSDVLSKSGPMVFCESGNTALYAIHLAYRMGASMIAMAGVDLYWPPGRRSHAFGSGKERGCKNNAVPQKIAVFKTMAMKYAEVGVKLVSVSPWDTRLRRAVGYTPLPELILEAKRSYRRRLVGEHHG